MTGNIRITSIDWLLNAKIRLRVLSSDRECSSNVFPTATNLKVFHHELPAATRLLRSLRLDDANSAGDHVERRSGRTAQRLHERHLARKLRTRASNTGPMFSPRSPAGPGTTQKACAIPTTTASWLAPVATGVVDPVALKADFALLMTYVTSVYSVVRLDSR
jgi:hypothetical protein